MANSSMLFARELVKREVEYTNLLDLLISLLDITVHHFDGVVLSGIQVRALRITMRKKIYIYIYKTAEDFIGAIVTVLEKMKEKGEHMP